MPFPLPTSTTVWSPEPLPEALAPTQDALVFYHAHPEWGRNDPLAQIQLTRVADAIRKKLEVGLDQGLWRGGVMIDTPAEWTEKGLTKWVELYVRLFQGGCRPSRPLTRDVYDDNPQSRS